MDNCVRFAMEANRKYVQAGLDRRKLEHQLEDFECDMIRRCNEKHEAARWQRQAQLNRELCKARIVARAEQREKAEQIRKDISLACLIFFAFAVAMLQLATWTHLPVVVALTLIGFGVLFLVSYIRDPYDFPRD